METIEERRVQSGGPNLLVLKAEILSALSSVGTATTAEEVRQANMAYKKALHTARRKGYRPHIRATEGKQIQTGTVCEPAQTSNQTSDLDTVPQFDWAQQKLHRSLLTPKSPITEIMTQSRSEARVVRRNASNSQLNFKR